EGEGEGEGETSDCPESVPAEYRDTWDCTASTCPGGTIVYHYGSGSSDSTDQISVTEKWYLFSESSSCMDVWDLSGERSPIDPTTFGAPGAETVWEVEWTLQTGNACGVAWGGLFAPGFEGLEGPFSGFIQLDTHSELDNSRNEDNAVLVSADVLDDGRLVHNVNFARGTATPMSTEDGPPERYEWVSEIRIDCD
ncbi:MAG TPA: hypothetical protein DFR83_10450, partial [Deltaproteobacteria bacterium]|nr:hypothetical protein [Deltaproteobacteria bacterium]